MGRPSAGIYFAFLLLVLLVEAGLLLGKGILLIDQHEGDALHLIQITLRMAEGQWPHLDFMTPIGVLAFAPVSWLISLGVGVGNAVMGGMVLVAILMLPAIWWVGYSRLTTKTAIAFGGFLVILNTALVYGGDIQVASISMYYNRWAWSVAFLLVLIAVLPAARPSQSADGVVIGLGLAFLALSKITFFVAFLPGIVLALVLRQHWRALIIGVSAGVLVGAVMTMLGGLGFWAAYIADIRGVSSAGIRAFPGETLIHLLIGSNFLAANLCLLAGVILLRQAEKQTEGLVLLVFAPAFVYVTYQNWGNDPKWLLLVAILLLALRPERHINNALGWDVGRSMGVVSLLSTVLILPSLYNLALANIRHARLSSEGFFQILPGQVNNDVAMKTARMYAPAKRQAMTLSDPKITAMSEAALTYPKDDLFGQALVACKLEMGLVGVLHQMSRDLAAVEETTGKSVFVADTFSNLWLFGPSKPVPQGAPWYYGGDQSLHNADFLLIPFCPVTPAARSDILAQLPNSGLNFQEISRTDLYILLRILPD